MAGTTNVLPLVLGIILFSSGTDGQQCSFVNIFSEGSGTYSARFSAASSASFVGLTVELFFDNPVNSLSFDSGHVEKVDDYHFKLISSGWVAEPGWMIDFTFSPQYSGSKPIVVGAKINDQNVCGEQSKQCSCISSVSGGGSSYTATFSLIAASSFNGLTVELTFDQAVQSIDFSSGSVEKSDDHHFKLSNSGYGAKYGETVEFTFTPHYSDGKPIVIGAFMNGQDVCDGGPGPTVAPPDESCKASSMTPYDYSQVLCMSFLFYEAQRSGALPSSQRVNWRGDSAMNDGKDVGHDLTGGYYDAGDFVKFGFPMAFTNTFLAWGLIDFSDGFEKAGQTAYAREAIRWGTDYFLKAHTGYFELYGQVGDGYADHAYWGRPEDMTMNRPSAKIDGSHPGSELAAETAAALAAASIVFKNVDSSYSSKCLTSAKELYDFADQKRGNYHDSIPGAADFYKSWSGYGDELCWAALWLNRATGDSQYLQKARGHWNDFNLQGGTEGFNWDNKQGGVYGLYALLDSDSLFRNSFSQYLSYMRNNKQYTPGGLVFIDKWGTNRHAANVAFLGFLAAKNGIDASANRQWAEGQINYMMGDNGRSFVVGYGQNPPQKPHHRSSSCPDRPQTCDSSAMNSPGANPQVLYGALVGGPDEWDGYTDDRQDYVHNEVACDYNAGFTGALAALVELK